MPKYDCKLMQRSLHHSLRSAKATICCRIVSVVETRHVLSHLGRNVEARRISYYDTNQ